MNALEFFKKRRIPTALASSSAMRLITNRAEQFSLENTLLSFILPNRKNTVSRIPPVFLTTAKHLRISPAHCLVIEDSFNGLIAAKAARMKTVVIPMAEQWNEARFDIADTKLKSLRDFSEQLWNHLNTLP